MSTKEKRKDMIKKITLKDLNPHVICVLCRGYFIDPVTIVECLHSFCKTCIVEHIKQHKNCPVCDTQINKTKPYLSMRLDKALQNIVYKLVPGLYSDEMDRRKKFQEKHEPTKVPKEELEKHFFFRDDKISMSLEYFDTNTSNTSKNNNNDADAKNNPNKRYLSCPGTVKIQHLMKFITMKYGLNSESFVVDVIYKGDIIPQDYTLIDVAYYYKWEKDAPMQFFYRIFKKNKVLLKRRKRKSLCEDKISDPKKVKTLEVSNNVPNKGETTTKVNKINNKTETTKNGDKENENKKNEIVDGGRTVNNSPPSLVDETKKEVKKAVVEDKEPPAPPTLKPASEKMDTSEDEDDKPPSEKKLKIDLKPEISEVKKAEKVEVKVKVKEPKIESKQTAETKIATSKQIAESKQAAENKSVVKPVIPKLINTEKQKSNLKLNNIVNNLTKKLTESSSPPPPPPPTKPALTKPAIAKPPSSLLGGQTTITKKDKIESKEAKKEVPKVKQSNRDENTKGIPSATSVTLKTMKTPSTTSSSSTSGSSPNATVSFSNSFKSKNGSSMMDFVQPSNGLSSPTKKPGSSTLSDLRQFRKESAKTPSSMPKSPITPSLTSRTLTLGNTKKSSPSSSSPTTSSFSSTLTKPLPKPGEASLTNNLLAAQAQISALASLGLGLTDAQKLGLTDAQKEYIKTMAAAANMSSLASFFQPPVSLPPSQQLPSNRLKLTVSQKSPSANPLQMLPSLASHMAPESQWTKSFSPSHFVGTTSNGHSTASSSPKFSSSLSKTMMNQSIRQIPNPSLLTKQASEQQQLLQRAIASHVAAASASGSRLSQ